MRKMLKKIIALFVALVLSFSFMNIAEADEVVADFEIDAELWKCILETNQFNYDENDDGIVTKEEFGGAYGIIIDAEGYDIKDWSGLKYGTEWQMIVIKNCSGGDFSALSELKKLSQMYFYWCADYKSIVGLEKIQNLTGLSITSDSEIDLSYFSNLPKLASLDAYGTSFSGFESLADYSELSSLYLQGKSVNNITEISELPEIYRLQLNFPDLNDQMLSDIVAKMPNLRDIVINNSVISSLDWIEKLDVRDYEHYYIDVYNNNISNIDALLEVIDIMNSGTFIQLGVNPISTEDRIKLIERVLSLKDGLVGYVGNKVSVFSYDHPIIDIVNENDFIVKSTNNEVAEVAEDEIIFKSPGVATIEVGYNDIELKYDIKVEEREIPFEPPFYPEILQDVEKLDTHVGRGITNGYIFTPEVSGEYVFSVKTHNSLIEEVPVSVKIYDQDYNMIAQSDSKSTEQRVYCEFDAGKSYYLTYTGSSENLYAVGTVKVYRVGDSSKAEEINTTDELWQKGEEITIDNIKEIVPNEKKAIDISFYEAKSVHKFTPTENGEYEFLAEGNDYIYFSILNEKLNYINSGSGPFTMKLQAGKTYVITSYISDSAESGLGEYVIEINNITEITRGDINVDEKVNAQDALLVLKHAAKIEILADELIDRVDINNDTKMDAKDALEILKIAAKVTE